MKLPHQFDFLHLQAFKMMGVGEEIKRKAQKIFSRIYEPKGEKPKKSTLYKHILRWDKRAGYSKKKILLLYNFWDQMHVNAVAPHLQHKWMPYPQFQQPLFYWVTSQSFHLSLFTESCLFLFQEKINRLFCDLSSFFLHSLACFFFFFSHFHHAQRSFVFSFLSDLFTSLNSCIVCLSSMSWYPFYTEIFITLAGVVRDKVSTR